MSGLDLGELTGRIGIDISGLTQGLAQGNQALARFTGAAGPAAQATSRVGAAARSAAAPTAAYSSAAQTAAQASGRWTDAQGRLREANGRFVAGARQAAQAADNQARSTGRAASSADSSVAKFAKQAAAAVGVGAAIRSTLKIGMDFETSLNSMGAVSGASAQQMEQVSKAARQLGNDATIPATSAATAAAAMTELSKGGLSVAQSMTAAKGTLQLAAAAQIDGAQAAEIQAQALNTFGLNASSAGMVADTLANTANAASGEITDFAQGLAQAGLPARQMGLSVQETSTALGLFANNGMKGSDAGTSLKTMLLSLASPTKQQAAALSALGVEAFNSQGKFVGLQAITGQLADASARMTDEQFNAAAATAFGNDAVRAAAAFASSGAEGYEKMAAAVGKTGGAAELAGAQMTGMRGAFAIVQNAVEDAQIGLTEKLSPALQDAAKQLAGEIPNAANQLTPALGAATTAAVGLAVDALPLLTSGAGLVGPALELAGSGAQALGNLLGPVVSVVGGAVDALNNLPGPAGAATAALLGMVLLRGRISGLATSIGNLSRRGSGMADYFRAGAIAAADAGSRMPRISGALRGVGMAAGAAGRGISAAFGGPVGLAIVGVTTALSIFADKNAEAQAREEEHRAKVQELASSFNQLSGAITQATKDLVGQDLASSKQQFDELGVSTGALVNNLSGGAAGIKAGFDAIAAGAEKTGKISAAVNALSKNGEGYMRQLMNSMKLSREEIGKLAISGPQGVAQLDAAFRSMGYAPQDAADAVNRLRADVENFAPGAGTYRVAAEGMSEATVSAGRSAATTAQQIADVGVKAGVSASQMQTAWMMVTTAGQSVEETLQKAGISGQQYAAIMAALPSDMAVGADGFHYIDEAAAQAAASAEGAGDGIKGAGEAAAGAGANLETAAGGMQKVGESGRPAAETADGLKESLAGVETNAGEADTRLQAFSLTLDGLSGRNADLAKVTQFVNSSLTSAEQAFRDSTKSVTDRSEALAKAQEDEKRYAEEVAKGGEGQASAQRSLDETKAKIVELNAEVAKTPAQLLQTTQAWQQTGTVFDTSTEQGQKLETAIQSLGPAYQQQVQQALNATAATSGLDAGMAAARTSADGFRAQLLNNAAAYGLTQSQMQGVLDKIGAVNGTKLDDKTLQLLLNDESFNAGMASAGSAKLDDKTVNLLGNAQDALAKLAGVNQATTPAKTLALLGNAKDALKKISAVDAAKLNPKTQKLLGDAKDALAKIGTVDKTNIKAKTVQVDAATKAARDALAAVKADVEGLPNAQRTIEYRMKTGGSTGPGARQQQKATGGMVYGPGTGTSDSIPVWLSNGEGVNTAAAMEHPENRRAMDFMNAGGVIPGFKDGGLVSNVKYKVTPAGAVDLTKLTAEAGTAMMAAAQKALEALMPKVPQASSAGVEQWRALALKVAADKGYPPSSVQIMLNQMTRESSGNPAAINLYDINARRGTPSKGLLQFIDPTFRAYADPGYNTNIWDPESQMRAWYNYVPARYGSLDYLTRIGYGAYAAGGIVRGPGTGRSDSILARVSNGEGINTAAAMKHPANRAAMHYMNAGGIIPGFADGGMVRAFDLAGRTRNAPGERQGNILTSLQGVLEFLTSFRQAANETTSAANESAKAAAQNRGALRSLSGESKRRVYEAKLEAQAVVRAAEASMASARAAESKTAADAKAKAAALESARAALASARGDKAKSAAQKAYNDALSRSRTASAAASVAASVASRTEHSLDIIRRQQATQVVKVTAAEKRRVATAVAEQKALDQRATRDRKAADAAKSKADAEDRAYRATAKARAMLNSLGAQYDKTAAAFEKSSDRLASLQNAQQSMRSSLRDKIGDYGGGILGNSEQRRTGADVLRGLQFNAAKLGAFSADLAKARALGVNAGLLEQIASAGVEGGGTTARALATSSKALVQRINQQAAANLNLADRGAVTVAQANYQSPINAQNRINAQLAAKMDRLDRTMGGLAGAVTKAMVSQLRAMTPQQLAVFVAQGDKERKRR